jgi:hypothetical protein
MPDHFFVFMYLLLQLGLFKGITRYNCNHSYGVVVISRDIIPIFKVYVWPYAHIWPPFLTWFLRDSLFIFPAPSSISTILTHSTVVVMWPGRRCHKDMKVTVLQSKAPSKVARGYNRRCGRRVSGRGMGPVDGWENHGEQWWGKWWENGRMGPASDVNVGL